jgi:uncharacterized protein (DUF885 family)
MESCARLLLIATVLLLGGCAALRPPATPAQELDRLVESWFDEYLELNPTTATDIGDHRFDDRIELPATPAYAAASADLERRYHDAVAAIDPRQLDDTARLTREMFLYNRAMQIERSRHPQRLLPLNQFNGGLATDLAVYGAGTGSQPFATIADYDRWLARAALFPRWVDQAIAAMREGVAAGIVHPRVVMAKVVPQLDALVAVDPADSIFYGPVARMPPHWPEAERARLESAIARLIVDVLNPAYRRLGDFMRARCAARRRPR